MSPEIFVMQLSAREAGGFYEVPLTVRLLQWECPYSKSEVYKKGEAALNGSVARSLVSLSAQLR